MADVRRWQRVAPVLAAMVLPALLWAGSEALAQTVNVGGETIKPRLVERIKNGETKKHEILTYFGEPQEVERTPDGMVYKYFSYKDSSTLPYKPETRKPVVDSEHLSNPFYLDENKNIKMVGKPKGGKVLRRSLMVRFKPDGETVLSHEYREY
jgi:hypothetical protein